MSSRQRAEAQRSASVARPLAGRPGRAGSFGGRGTGTLGVLLLGGLLALPAAAAAPLDTAALERGEILVSSRPVAGYQVPEFEALCLVEATPEKVWAVIDRCAAYAGFMPRVSRSEELSRQGTLVTCLLEIDLPFPLGSLLSVTEADHLALGDRRFTRRWRLQRGDFVLNQGRWEIAPWGDGARSLIRYSVITQPRTALPDRLQSYFQRRGLFDILGSLRRRLAATVP